MHREPIDRATQAKFMYLFERLSEPVYFGPRGSGANRVLYLTPLDKLPPNVAKAVVELRKGIPLDSVKTVDVSYSSVPYDLTHVKTVPKEAIFSPFCQLHRDAASALIKIFSDQKSLSDFFNAACMCRDEVNSHLWVYSLGRAIILRPDMKGFKLPAIWEIMPDRFMNGSVLREARRQERLPLNQRSVIVVDQSFTGIDLNPENKLAYFREDIALNSAHWIWHIVYPIDAPPGQRDRKGELFYKMHHDLVGRYDAERLGNGLGRVVPLDILGQVEEGYFPKLTLENSSQQWGTRQPNTTLKNINRILDPNNRVVIDLYDMNVWQDRILDAIDKSLAITSNGQPIPLGNEQGIDVVGDMVEASTLSPNEGFYGSFHNLGHFVIAFSVDPDYRFKENFGVMGATETAIRDPSFFRWHRAVDNIFTRHKNTLPPYTVENLFWTGLTITSLVVRTEDRTPNTLVTFWEQRDVDLSRGLDFGRGNFNNLGRIPVRLTHLQHEAFIYNLEVTNSTGQPQIGTVRIFMAPRLDEHRIRLTFSQQRGLFFEMDKFTVSLNPGKNVFQRRSVDSSVTIPWEQSFEDLERTTQVLNPEQVICGCGWPQHLLVPKGNAEGQKFDIFAMITNWEEDRVRRKNPASGLESSSCKQSIVFCGILNELFPDTKPMGFPFDRVPRPDSNGQAFEYLEDWMIQNSNMKTTQVKVMHRNVTFLAEGSTQNSSIIVQGQKGFNYFPEGFSRKIEARVPYSGKSQSMNYQAHQPDVRVHSPDWVDLGSKPYYNGAYTRRNPRNTNSLADVDASSSLEYEHDESDRFY